MFSDTHFHLKNLIKKCGIDGRSLFESLCKRKTFFALDIGTECDDLEEREKIAIDCISSLESEEQKETGKMLYFSAGIWPSVEEIENRFESIKILENSIKKCAAQEISGTETKIYTKICAIGECGLDHHWNKAGADHRDKTEFNDGMFHGEKELFEMQLELAERLSLPVIVHTREAFEGTLDSLKNLNCNNGIIHCYSYGKNEARAFLDMGLYIAFGGSTTYTKKSHIEEMQELLRYVPDDRILLETDAPYLAPVPFRGQVNTPVLIEHSYNFIAAARNTTPETLSETVDKNIRTLFKIE